METKTTKRFLAAVLLTIIWAVIGCASLSSGTDSSSTTCQNFTKTTTAASLWIELSPTGTVPDGRSFSASAFDAATDCLVAFGGKDGSGVFGDTEILCNASDISATPDWKSVSFISMGSAPQLYGAVTALKEETLFVFGGSTSDTSSNIKFDLWELTNLDGSGGTPTWSQVTISGTAPETRALMSGVYDEATDKLILFGGTACFGSVCTLYNDTWTINQLSTHPTWEHLFPSGTSPPERFSHSAVYDATNNRMIIFGGNASTSSTTDVSLNLNDTWVLSNANNTGGTTPAWSELQPTTLPSAVMGHTAVYDKDNDRMIVYGGLKTDNTLTSDVSILVSSRGLTPQWTGYNTGTPIPDGRELQNTAYTGSEVNRMILFGGSTGNSHYANDSWVLQNANGIPSSPVASVTISSGSTTVCATNTDELIAIAIDENGDTITGCAFSWSSSDDSIATIDANGLVTGVAAGTVTITATAVCGISDASAETTLTITASDSTDSSGDSGGGSSGGTCAGGWMGSTASWGALGSFDACTQTGTLSTCITQTDFENGTGLPFPSACSPDGASGCINAETGTLMHPCCAGSACVYRTRCGGTGAVNGSCIVCPGGDCTKL